MGGDYKNRMNSKTPNKEPMQLLEDVFSQAEEIINSFTRKLAEEPPPPLIYHYTDGTGLRGILESGKLWFTDIFSLNDPTELRHGLNSAIEILKQLKNNKSQELDFFLKVFQKMVNSHIESTAHHFICCFSKDGDDLGQWRAYADNGRGYAIGFDGDMLTEVFLKSTTENRAAFPITYGDDPLHEMQTKIIEMFIPLFSLDSRRVYQTKLATSLAVQLAYSSLFFKHKAYRNEEECRFSQIYPIGPSVEGVKLRDRRYSLIRYIEFDWRTVAAGSLKKIIIGPAADRSLARHFADECLREFHRVEGVEIDQSFIPYRAL